MTIAVLVSGLAVLGIAQTASARAVSADYNGDGVVNVLDLSRLLGGWSQTGRSSLDLTGDGKIDILDLSALLSDWGPSPVTPVVSRIPTPAPIKPTPTPLATSKKVLQYFVMPHPDDENEGWSLVANSPGNYSIFILLTHGEETGHCLPGDQSVSLQTGHGEIAPSPWPYAGKWTSACEGARLSSWNGYLDDMASVDSTLSRPKFFGHFTGTGNTPAGLAPVRLDGDTGQTRLDARGYDVWRDGSTARVIFNLGDGDLTADEVTWAIQTVRSHRGELFPLLPENAIIGSAYYNASYPGCYVYTHPDHRAVHVALYSTDQGTPGPQWAATCPSDPDVAATAGRTATIPDQYYDKMYGVSPAPNNPRTNPDATRTGFMLKHYGWLEGSYFWGYDTDEHNIWSQSQSFWKKY